MQKKILTYFLWTKSTCYAIKLTVTPLFLFHTANYGCHSLFFTGIGLSSLKKRTVTIYLWFGWQDSPLKADLAYLLFKQVQVAYYRWLLKLIGFTQCDPRLGKLKLFCWYRRFNFISTTQEFFVQRNTEQNKRRQKQTLEYLSPNILEWRPLNHCSFHYFMLVVK